MEIVVKRGRPVSKQVSRQKLSVAERTDLLGRKEEIESQLQDASTSHIIRDKGSLQRNLEIINNKLQEDSSLEATGREKDKLVKQKEELERTLKNKIDPITQQFIKPGHPDYDRAVQAAIEASDPSISRVAEVYKDVSLRIEPNDPTSGSIEKVLAK